MRIKKKDLRRRLPQLPINYPGPVIEEPFRYEREAGRVENLCTRLADNEVETRDAVLREVPRFLLEVCSRTEFVALARLGTVDSSNSGLPSSFSYEDLAEFLEAPTEEAAAAVAAKKIAANPTQLAIFFTPAVRELSLLFDKLNLGIFYNIWHSDKPLVQHDNSQRVAMLVHVPPSVFLKLLFWRSMWRALAAKWSIIDHHRIDKYMSYVRKLSLQSLRVIATVTVKEARPLTWSEESSSSSSSSRVVISTTAQDILADAMRLIGNDARLAAWKQAAQQFQQKRSRHLALKQQRRDEQAAALEAKAQKKKDQKAAAYNASVAAAKAAAAAAAPAGKKRQQAAGAAAAAAANSSKKGGKGGKKQETAAAAAAAASASKKPTSKASATAAAAAAAPAPAPAPSPAAAPFLTAFSDLLKHEIFTCGTSVGLSMHLADVILDECRRCHELHAYPSVILALLASVPVRTMAMAEVLQIERRVTLMVLQPIAGGVFERFFEQVAPVAKDGDDDDEDDEAEDEIADGDDALASERKLMRSLNAAAAAAEEDDDDDDDEEEEDDEDGASAKKKKKQNKSKKRNEQEQLSEEEDPRFQIAVQKSVALAEAVHLALQQIALDPRTRFAMRPLLEEASRSVNGYVLLRRRPDEFQLVTKTDKRRMLHEAVSKKMFGSSLHTDEAVASDPNDTAAKAARLRKASITDGAMARKAVKQQDRYEKKQAIKKARIAAGLPDPRKRVHKEVLPRRKKLSNRFVNKQRKTRK